VRHLEIMPLDLILKMRSLKVRIVERISAAGCEGRRGYWDTNNPEWVTIGWRAHKATDHAADMANTLIHETIHSLRPTASEWWVRRRAGLFAREDKVCAEAALRLLNAVFFDDYIKSEV